MKMFHSCHSGFQGDKSCYSLNMRDIPSNRLGNVFENGKMLRNCIFGGSKSSIGRTPRPAAGNQFVPSALDYRPFFSFLEEILPQMVNKYFCWNSPKKPRLSKNVSLSDNSSCNTSSFARYFPRIKLIPSPHCQTLSHPLSLLSKAPLTKCRYSPRREVKCRNDEYINELRSCISVRRTKTNNGNGKGKCRDDYRLLKTRCTSLTMLQQSNVRLCRESLEKIRWYFFKSVSEYSQLPEPLKCSVFFL
jgi:hypothetical protein